MMIQSKWNENYIKLVDALGIYFQIRDDYCNLADVVYVKNKGFAEDLTEGKYSFPVVHAINQTNHGQIVENILRQRTQDTAVKEYCVGLLKESLVYTKQRIDYYDSEVRRIVQECGGNGALIDILDELKKTIPV